MNINIVSRVLKGTPKDVAGFEDVDRFWAAAGTLKFTW